jgi:MOSC domain-containing protein YiiM
MSDDVHATRDRRPASFADDLAACAARILGEPGGTFAGAGEERAVAGLGERLATRNLGLLRVADPATFAWPGPWIAVVATPDGARRAAVFFGVPSGPLEAHDEALAAGATIIDGYVVAPLDLHAVHGIDAYGRADHGGTVVGVFTAPAKEAPCVPHTSRAVRAGQGLDGDRYAIGAGTFSHPQRLGQALTLIEGESLDDLRARGVELSMADARRNVVTRGVRLNQLIGHHFTIGNVRCYGSRLAEPCAHLERITSRGVLRGLVHRGGIRADVLDDGVVSVGDAVRPLTEPEI